MRALVVYESIYGNTRQAAEQLGKGLAETFDVTLADVNESTPVHLSEFALIVLGGPTHAFGMSTPQSRSAAGTQAGTDLGHLQGIREWISNLGSDYAGDLATFDTKMGRKWMPGCASKTIQRQLRRMGYRPIRRTSFLVSTTRGPLRKGELYRAHAWGNELAIRARHRLRAAGGTQRDGHRRP